MTIWIECEYLFGDHTHLTDISRSFQTPVSGITNELLALNYRIDLSDKMLTTHCDNINTCLKQLHDIIALIVWNKRMINFFKIFSLDIEYLNMHTVLMTNKYITLKF